MSNKKSEKAFSHLDEHGEVQMVDISSKNPSLRLARAEGYIWLKQATIEAIQSGKIAKGNVFTTAKLAAINAAKQTAVLVPLCHNLSLTWASVDLTVKKKSIYIRSTVKARDATGVEMEALTAVAAAALTIYDMCKAVDKSMLIGDIRLVEKKR